MTQLQTAPVVGCNTLLRQARELLAQGQLATASAVGWDAAALAMADYAGSSVAFTDAAQELVKDDRGHTDAAEWVVSALALSDNAGYDWLDVDGVSRRLDDVQRLVILVKDIENPPQGSRGRVAAGLGVLWITELWPRSVRKGLGSRYLRATKTCARRLGL